MRIAIAYAPPMRRWQQRLAELLRTQGHEVAWTTGEPRRLGIAIRTALAFEQRLLGPRPSLFDAISPDAIDDAARILPRAMHREGCVRRDPGPLEKADLVIVLDGIALEAPFGIEPLFDGAPGDAALIAMLTSGRSPYVEVRTIAHAETIDVVTAILAVSDRDVLSRALDQVLTRIVTLIGKSVRRAQRDSDGRNQTDPQHPHGEEQRSRVSNHEGSSGRDAWSASWFETGFALLTMRLLGGGLAPSSLTYMARAWLHKIAGRLSGGGGGPSHWRVGYRNLGATPAIVGNPTCYEHPFTILPDDGRRFYADPVPFEHEGRTFLFVEEFPYATGKGVIAVAEIAADGTASPVRQVLEQPWHLSYPHLVRHGGEIYMLPEMSAARCVQLFRAEQFPDRWVPDRILLDDIVAADATVVEHAGRWWMFATLADDGGSSWDQLCLFHAPDLFGPWVPHAANPVLVDAGAARPAGAMWHADDGTLMRVAQDCRTGYGVGLAICRVDQLDARAFAQTLVARHGPPGGLGSDGTHTLGRADNLEVIDLRCPSVSR